MFKQFVYKLKYRRAVQVGSFVFNNSFFLPMKWCPTVGMNCYACPLASTACPIGTLQHFMVIRQIPYFLIGMLAAIGAFFGRMICGWACPIGWLQEIIHKIPTPKWKVRWKPLPYLKYVVLVVLVLAIPFWTGEPWFSKLCFVGTVEAGAPLAIFDASIREMIGPLFFIKLGITLALVSLFIFVKRPFCRFLCPLGAIYSLTNRFSYLNLQVDGGCTSCNRCQKACPMDIKVYENPNSGECIRCLECTAVCEHVHLCAGKKQIQNNQKEGVEVHA